MLAERLGYIIGTIGLGLNAAGIVFVAVQVVLARRQFRHAQGVHKSEIVRGKRQATIDFYMTTVEQRSKWKEILPDDWDKEEVERFISDAFRKKDRASLRCLADYLGYLESLAVATAADVYDLEMLDSLAGARIITIALNYKTYFEKTRSVTGVADLYVELEWLCGRLQELRAGAPSYVLFAHRNSTGRSLAR